MEGARRFCQQRHGDLVTINSEEESVFLWKQRNKCVAINTSPVPGIGKWISKSCNDTNGFVCIQNVETYFTDFPDPTTDYVKMANDSIKTVTQKMTWNKAKQHCEGNGAKLASLKNEWNQAYVELMALNLQAPLWIGLNKMETNGYFRYIDGWTMSFTHWGNTEPSSDRPCVYIDVDGKWKTAYCNQTMNSVCMTSTAARINRSRSNIALAVVLVIVGIAVCAVTAVFLSKKLGCRSPIPDRLTAFDNPLFNKICSQPDQVDTNKLVENAEEENPEPIITSKNAESNE
ncbi:hypothetical protein PAMP_005095 [Pampus punctatissimus]